MAALSPQPRLAPGVIVRRIVGRDETWTIAKEPETSQYFRFEEWEYDLLALLDGTRDLDALAEAMQKSHPGLRMDAQDVADAVEGYRGVGLIERDEREKQLGMMDQLKTLRRRRYFAPEGVNLFQIDIKMFDPDKILTRLVPRVRWIWSPWFVVPWLVIFAVVLGTMMQHWDLYWAGFFSLWNLPERGAAGWLVLLALLFGVSLWHEFGHAATCKRFGGEVHDIGVMIFYLQPAFYCRTDDSYLFPSRAHRIWTTFGGAYFELMLCSVAAAIWILTPAEWTLHSAALTIVFFTGLSVIALNVNPLIRLDGYYVLMDWLDVPDLREDSFRYMGNILKQRLLHLKVDQTPVPRRRRRIYLIYGICSIVYTTLLLTFLFGLFRRLFEGWLGPAGILALLAAAGWMFRKKLAEGWRFGRFVWLDKREMLMQPKRLAAAGVAALGVIALLTLPRTATRVDGEFVVEPGERAVVRAPAAGMIGEVLVAEGTAVKAGAPLARLVSAETHAGLRAARAEEARLGREAAREASAGNTGGSFGWRDLAAAAHERGLLAARRTEELLLRAPIAGVVTTRDPGSRAGRYLEGGETFCMVDRIGTVRLETELPESEIEEIGSGTPVRILARADEGRTLRALVLSIAPAARPPAAGAHDALDLIRPVNRVAVAVEIANAEALLRPGMTGRIQFLTTERSVAGKWWRGLRRWAGRLIW